ncbi:uncharacterized protein BYT42DRAFT_193272 [Radiomyces spectabilis]|uniref:uncharacterized protein n=1 Tax=Radiomyces spectabilis TaxID=64574 RepID=UPI00221F16A1|nr:uncharacterized protein BYT42DRAFT_193272 [Radiomyces spectabilis]KAI8391404.1 hypothetical protein BYT42DRAFT_193272 [Radiomyces spectabilis]
MLPPLSDIAPIHYSSMSGVRSTDPWWGNTELRPILNHPAKPSTDPLPFNHDALTPSASPSPPINDHINWSPKSSQCNSRKGSIASLLNTDPELRQLDEEELRNGYQSHFDAATDDHDDNSDHGCSRDGGVQKRGRPSATVYSSPDAKIKKRKCATKKKLKRSTQVDPEQRPIHKGLRHFSKQVCNKVAHHGVTTYNEVNHYKTLLLTAVNRPTDNG